MDYPSLEQLLGITVIRRFDFGMDYFYNPMVQF